MRHIRKVATMLVMILVLSLFCAAGLAQAQAQDAVPKDVRVTSVRLNRTALVIDPKRTYQLTATVRPSNADDKTVTWSSNSPLVATVDPDGTVRPKGNGTALITASAGAKKAVCKVVVRDLSVTSVKVLPARATVFIGRARLFAATVSPALAGSPSIVWSSGDPEIATVDENTGEVRGISKGSVRIYAKNPESGKIAIARVTVKPIPVKRVTIDETLFPEIINKGETVQAAPAVGVEPADATSRTIAWTSSDPSVATIDAATGEIQALSAGVTKIKAIAGGKSATRTLRVRGRTMQFSITAGGDVTLGGDPRQQKYATGKMSTFVRFDELVKGGHDPFKNVRKYFQGDDNIAFINYEGSLTNRRKLTRKGDNFVFVGRPAYADMLTDAYINVCNLANNQASKFGSGGVSDTKRLFNARGIKHMSRYNPTTAFTLTKDGITVKVGFCGYQMPVSNATVRRDIRLLKQRGCDMVVVSFHFTTTKGWISKLFPSDQAKARAAINSGATLVLGHHHHVVSGLEMYKGRMIVYDLGNLIAGVRHVHNNYSMLFQQQFQVDETGFVEGLDFKVIPLITTTETTATYPATDLYGEKDALIGNWQPDVLTGEEADKCLSFIQSMSRNVVIPKG